MQGLSAKRAQVLSADTSLNWPNGAASFKNEVSSDTLAENFGLRDEKKKKKKEEEADYNTIQHIAR